MLKLSQLRKYTLAATLFVSLMASNSFAQQVTDQVAPEGSTVGEQAAKKAELIANEFMVVSAHPLATQAGYDIIKQGGNATDAMVAVQTVLGLVEPQSSGMGGGAFLVYYKEKNKKLTTYDARETSPLDAPNDLFIGSDEKPMNFFDAVVGGRSVGTPGTPKLLWTRHKEEGLLSWKEVLEPAIRLAYDGFEVTPRMAGALKIDQKRLSLDPAAKALYYPDDKPLSAGQVLVNKEYGDTLSLLAKHGGDYFYSSEFAKSIISKVAQHPNKGYLSQKDFDQYKVIERPAVCSPYLDYAVCGMGPPSSGAIAVGQTLRQLEFSEFSSLEPESAQAWHYVAESSRMAFADRGRYVADTDFVPLPSGLLSDTYLKQRATLINPKAPSAKIKAGIPQPDFTITQTGIDVSQASTSHFVIVDKLGNIVSMTTTIENGFGSRQMVNGFLLNNELTDFSFISKGEDGKIANSVEPGKRPRSSMAPTIVFSNPGKDGEMTAQSKPILAIGSPGGSRIIPYVTNSLIRILSWGQRPDIAVNRPHVVNRFGTMDIEKGAGEKTYLSNINAMGYQTKVRSLNSGLHAVLFKDGKLVSAVDSRREGLALGD